MSVYSYLNSPHQAKSPLNFSWFQRWFFDARYDHIRQGKVTFHQYHRGFPD